jgi:hypothetical protein
LVEKYLSPAEMIAHDYPNDARRASIYKKKLSRKRLHELIENRLLDLDGDSPPFLTTDRCDFIVKDRRINTIPSMETRYGIMILEMDHFNFFVNDSIHSADDRGQYRTILSHEIGHTFLYNYREKRIEPMHHVPSYMSWLLPTEFDDEKELIASELGRRVLIPGWAVEALVGNSPKLSSLIRARDIFDVEISFIARRLMEDVHFHEKNRPCWENCFAVIQEKGVRPRKIIGNFPMKPPFTTVNDWVDTILQNEEGKYFVESSFHEGKETKLVIY